MRSMNRWIEVCAGAIFLTALLLRPAPGNAALQVVGDEACALYEVDIASFATCEGDRVTKPSDEHQDEAIVIADEGWRD